MTDSKVAKRALKPRLDFSLLCNSKRIFVNWGGTGTDTHDTVNEPWL